MEAAERLRPASRLPIAFVLFLSTFSVSCKRPAYDAQSLLESLSVAERLEETRLIDFDSIGGSVVEGKFHFFRDKDGSFVLPPRDLPLAFYDFTGSLARLTISGLTTGRPLDVPVSVNGNRLGVWGARTEIGSQIIVIPNQFLKKGLNVLTLGVGSLKDEIIGEKARVRLVSVVFDRKTGTPSTGAGSFYYNDRQMSGYWQASSTPEIRMFVNLPAGPSLLRLSAGNEGPSEAVIEWTPEGGASHRIFSVNRGRRGLSDCSVALEGGGPFGELVMKVTTGRVFWGNPRIAVEGEAPAVRVSPPRRRFNVLVFLVDTLRADELELYGYDRETSPSLQRLARECMVFTNALGHTAWTKPSVATLLTGLYPAVHHVTQHDRFVHPKLVTLAERMPGFYKVFVSAHPVITRETGYAQGFDAGAFSYPQKQAPDVYEHLKPVLDDIAAHKQPFFLYVHTIDPHYPYDPAPPFDLLVEHNGSDLEHAPDLLSKAFIGDIKRRAASLNQRDVRFVRSLYDSEVARADFYFAKILEELQRRRLYDDTMIIFTADHGEEFRDHGGFEHGHTLYQEIVRLPLIIKPPKGLGRPGDVADRVRQIDIAPTLLDLLGLGAPSDLPGRSFAGVFSGDAYDAGTVFAETELETRLVSATNGEWKLIMSTPSNPAASKADLFDLESDPGETTDLAGRHPMAAKFLRQELRRWEAECRKEQKLSAGESTRTLSASDVEALKALGYVD